ncbi:hypothetical protein CK203_005602 [Vitis vinifera]|uniref:Uncharacterized protein n=1 Tax=Vitis vinifera TaxID=29760 RepID=A0A438K3H0_VITVI|nr:hypothetical protein CK203_005602 [Vitis vinifera]
MGTLEQVFGVSLCSYGEQCQAFTRLSWIAPKTIRWPSLLIQVIGIDVSVKIDNGNLHLPPKEIFLRTQNLFCDEADFQLWIDLLSFLYPSIWTKILRLLRLLILVLLDYKLTLESMTAETGTYGWFCWITSSIRGLQAPQVNVLLIYFGILDVLFWATYSDMAYSKLCHLTCSGITIPDTP